MNIPARITLLGVYPTDRTTRQEMRDVERIKAMHYSEYLAEITKKFDGEFVEYNPIGGCWTFTVSNKKESRHLVHIFLMNIFSSLFVRFNILHATVLMEMMMTLLLQNLHRKTYPLRHQ